MLRFYRCLSFQVTAPSFGPVTTHELLHHMTGKGLSAKYQFPRQPCLYQPSMVAVQVILTNNSDHCLEKIHIGERSPASLNIQCFNTIGQFQFHLCKIIHSQVIKELQLLFNPLKFISLHKTKAISWLLKLKAAISMFHLQPLESFMTASSCILNVLQGNSSVSFPIIWTAPPISANS